MGKQVWRQLHNTDSLYYEVFKAKYFPNGSIVDEDVKGGGSYAWQSIFKERKVINLGSIWWIGDGKKVKIRGDKWLPDLTSSKVIFPQKCLPMDYGYLGLCPYQWGWPKLVGGSGFQWIFTREASSILSLPLSYRSTTDKLIWQSKTQGTYTTKSAYKPFMDNEASTRPSTLNPTVLSGFLEKDLGLESA